MRKSATVYTNDPDNKTITLQLSANVVGFARYPKRINLNGNINEKISVQHTIVPEPQFKFDIVRTYADNGQYINFSLEKQKSQFTLTVENKRKTAGRYWDRIHLVTDSDKQKEITIPIYANLQDPNAKEETSQKQPNAKE